MSNSKEVNSNKITKKLFTLKKLAILGTYSITTDRIVKLKIGTLLQQYEKYANSLGSDIMTKDTDFNKNVIDSDEHHNQCSYTSPNRNDKRKHDHLCTEGALIIYFFLHPFMVYKAWIW